MRSELSRKHQEMGNIHEQDNVRRPATQAAMFNEEEGQLLGKTQRILLEVCTVLYFIAKNAAIPLIQQYVYALVDIKYNFTVFKASILQEENGEKLLAEAEGSLNGSSLQKSLDEEVAVMEIRYLAHKVNEESSLIILYLTVAELLPAALIVLCLGFYSDITGRRKFLMWLPCLGNALYALGFVLPLYICNGDIDHPATKILFVVASIASGLSGSVPGFLSGNASYISDTDTAGRRTLRLAIVEMIIGLTFGIVTFANGFWIELFNSFEQPLWFVFGCSLVPFFVLLLFLKEPNGEIASQLGQPTTFRDFRGVKHVFGLSSIPQKKLWAIFIAFQIYVFVQQGQERTFVLFLQMDPLYWRPIQIGTFLLVLYGLAGLGSWPGVPLLHKVCDDVLIAMLALISKAMGSFLLAFAKEDFTVYLSTVVQVFHLTPYAIARSLASKQVGEDEQGTVFALLHSVQSVVAFLGPVAHNAIFFGSLKFMGGLVFLVSGPLLVIPFMLLLYTKYLDRKEEGYMTMDGSNANKPLTPSMTPMSETGGFAQRPASDYSTTTEDNQPLNIR